MVSPQNLDADLVNLVISAMNRLQSFLTCVAMVPIVQRALRYQWLVILAITVQQNHNNKQHVLQVTTVLVGKNTSTSV